MEEPIGFQETSEWWDRTRHVVGWCHLCGQMKVPLGCVVAGWHSEYVFGSICECYLTMLMETEESHRLSFTLSLTFVIQMKGWLLPVIPHPAELVLQRRRDEVDCVPPAARPCSPLAVLSFFLHYIVGFQQKPWIKWVRNKLLERICADSFSHQLSEVLFERHGSPL